MSTAAYQQYKSTTVQQADPIRLVSLLYEGAIKHCALAEAALRGEDVPAALQSSPAAGGLPQLGAQRPSFEAAHNSILRVYAIVSELTATLDTQNGGAIAADLERLYDYILHLLREADLAKDSRLLVEARGLLGQLLQTWQQAFPAGLASVPEEFRGRIGPKRAESSLDTSLTSEGQGEAENESLPNVTGHESPAAVPAGLSGLDLTG